jgi:1,4-alpha-glucan branching enzyme
LLLAKAGQLARKENEAILTIREGKGGRTVVRKTDGGRIEFRFVRPAPGPVYLVGDFNDWNDGSHPMKQEEDGTWFLSLELPPGEYAYKFFSSGDWFNDPEADYYRPNVWGSSDSVVTVPGSRSRV